MLLCCFHHCLCTLLIVSNAFPMTQNIADTMAYLQGEGRLLRGEHNHLCEAFLVMASSAGYLATKPLCIYACSLKVVLVLLLSQFVFFFVSIGFNSNKKFLPGYLNLLIKCGLKWNGKLHTCLTLLV